MDEGSSRLTGEERGRAGIRYAQHLLDVNETAAALEVLSCLEDDVHVGEVACLKLGAQHAEMLEWSRSERSLRKALAHRESAVAWCLLHSTLFRGTTGREAESLDCLRRALEVDDTYEEAHANLAMRLRLIGDDEEAERHASRAVEIDPVYGFAFAELGALRISRKDALGNEEGLEHCRKAVQYDPNYYWGWIYLAVSLWKNSQLEQAEVAYSTACRLEPGWPIGWKLYSDFVLRARQDPERANLLAARASTSRQDELEAWIWTEGRDEQE